MKNIVHVNTLIVKASYFAFLNLDYVKNCTVELFVASILDPMSTRERFF